MEQVSLYDEKSDKVYDIMLSVEDEQRAATDNTFATSLLNAAILEEKGETIESLVVENNVQSNAIAQISDVDNADNCEGNPYRWSEASILLLLRTYEKMEQKFINGKFSHKKCRALIAEILKKQGYDVTGAQCSSKFRNLKKTYKSIKEHNSKSGNDRRTWQFFEIMDEMFSKKAWCKPVALASSTGLAVKNTNTEGSSITSSKSSYNDDSFDDKENDLPQKNNAKTTRTSVTQLLKKKLEQKEEHEHKKQKRHDDRMLLETRLIDTLTQFLNK